MSNYLQHPSSFRDPSGFIFQSHQQVYRQVNQSYAANYERLMQSGLYKSLTASQRLIPHAELNENLTGVPDWYKTLLPEQVPFISYPYEWCFEQMKDAALLVLDIVRESLRHDLILKDATPFNVQFHKGKPIWIDTLSFEPYEANKPWVAYRQFCECFLFPLYLGHYLKADIQKTLSTYLEGIPASLTGKLLPVRSGLSLGVWLHVYLQGAVKSNHTAVAPQGGFNRKKLLNLITHLETIIGGFRGRKSGTTWSDYYDNTIISQQYLVEKEKLFRQMLSGIEYDTALDAGTNDGHFAKIMAEDPAKNIVALDSDAASINRLYRHVKMNGVTNLLPLQVDITQPSPALGYRNKERAAFFDRVQTRLVTALALIHHLVYGKNIPLASLAGFFADITGKYLLIEFVPPTDPKVLIISRNRTATHRYDAETFEQSFGRLFTILHKNTVPGTERVLYLMEKKV
ncbi:MAG TPA: class I SAM-dependent methyltransferase [Chitinophagaceae bacterium]|nr:class I SAM-dependent methyltransferase [Chitinophagaceae bacterium]